MSNVTTIKFKGIEIDIGDQRLVCPPLSLSTIEEMRDRLEAMNGVDLQGKVATVIECAHAALKRNYPDITRQQVAEGIDLGTMEDVMLAVMDVSGVERKRRQEAPAC